MSVDPASAAANATTIRPARTRTGIISRFDEAVGLGEVIGDDGFRYLFQSIEIADGTRSIAVDTEVQFEPFGRFGEWQAGRIAPACTRPVPDA